MRDNERSNESDQLPMEHVGEGETSDDEVEDASADSFPASDPPSFTGSTATRDTERELDGADSH